MGVELLKALFLDDQLFVYSKPGICGNDDEKQLVQSNQALFKIKKPRDATVALRLFFASVASFADGSCLSGPASRFSTARWLVVPSLASP